MHGESLIIAGLVKIFRPIMDPEFLFYSSELIVLLSVSPINKGGGGNLTLGWSGSEATRI